MNRLLVAFLLVTFCALGKSNLNLSIQNKPDYPTAMELLQPLQNDVTFGNKNAKVTLTIFDSYSCIHCGRFYREIFPILEEKYIKTGKLFFVHKEFPLDKWALFATKTVKCSTNKEAQIKEIYANQPNLLATQDYENALLTLGSTNKECVTNFEDKNITDKIFVYSKVLNINSTPTVYINGEKINKMTQDRLLRIIEDESSK